MAFIEECPQVRGWPLQGVPLYYITQRAERADSLGMAGGLG